AQQTIPFMKNGNNYLLYLEDTSANIYEYSTISIDEELQQVNDIQFTNYPNPFSTSTTISFNIHRRDTKNAEIKIYNVKGQLVKCLECGESLSTIAPTYRDYSINWNGKDENGKQVPSGIYFCKLKVGKETIVRKMVLLR
ncbi:MAG: T9SS type A sorting domain-containing protein, partial [Candidatus Cloacimonetes bacterium]|nr:T9SS type A sorting domain-containing protein [Candidatus Cloacimonadota bacterium]